MFKVYRLVMMILVLIFMFSGLTYANVLLDKVVAVVNQEVITWSELYKSMESDAGVQMKELKDDEKRRRFKENESAYLDSLINVRLQLQEARKIGLTVVDAEVNEAINSIKKKYSMSDADFQESLKKEGYSLDDYRKRLGEQILIGKVVNQEIRSKIVVTEADISKFLRENPETPDMSEGYRIGMILFKNQKGEVERRKVEEKADLVMRKLEQGANFEDLARQYSEDSSGSAGGDLGTIRKNQLSKEFIEALAQMKTGEISKPFRTDRGLHIIRLIEKIKAKEQSQIREDAKIAVSNRVFMEKYNAWIKALRERSFIEVRL